MTVRAVVFDLGHTLWDIQPHDAGALEAAYAAMRADLATRLGRADLPDARAIQRAVGDVLRSVAETYFMTGEREEQPATHTFVDTACQTLGLELEETLLRELTPPLFATEIDRLYVAPGTVEAVRDLHDAGYALGCLTNTLADAATIHQMLRNHGFAELMQTVVVSSAEGYRKPHRSLFDKAVVALGVAAHDAVFVGDTPWHDIAGAQNAGMRGVLTRQYVTRPMQPEGIVPDGIISHVRELSDVIAGFDGA